jgi:hypothetical protein
VIRRGLGHKSLKGEKFGGRMILLVIVRMEWNLKIGKREELISSLFGMFEFLFGKFQSWFE